MMKLRGLTIAALADPNLFEISNLIGGPEGDALGRLKKLSPGEYLRDGVNLPPHLIIHGDCDAVVPFSQSSDYYRASAQSWSNCASRKSSRSGA